MLIRIDKSEEDQNNTDISYSNFCGNCFFIQISTSIIILIIIIYIRMRQKIKEKKTVNRTLYAFLRDIFRVMPSYTKKISIQFIPL